jgi:hypothetical protein
MKSANPQPAVPAGGLDLNAMLPNRLIGDYNQDGQLTAEEATAYRQMVMSQPPAANAIVNQAPAAPSAPANQMDKAAAGVVSGVIGGLFGR